jgi:hypothetical protein
VREQALLEPDHEHDRELQPLRRVQGHQQHPRVVGRALLLVHVRQQRQAVDEAGQARLGVAQLELEYTVVEQDVAYASLGLRF